MDEIKVNRANVSNGMAVIEFLNGTIGVYDAKFLLDNISRDGNQDMTALKSDGHAANKKSTKKRRTKSA